ncbi:MAG: 30S ribosomal protein S16 [Planctomycetes bacterium]|nr:30S ribosomal protein S16 [Planctomycetota bacterium]MBL7106862.1 30S ribosomal protein S16 [Phycisphaerae bacterium]
MAVKIRMTRMGRRHRPFFRINAIDSRTPRDGRILEKLGHYDPIEKNKEKQVVLNIERVKYWLDNGAIPSDTVSDILLAKGIKHKYAEQKAAKRTRALAQAKAKGVPFDTAQRVAIEKAKTAVEEKAKAEAQAKDKAVAEAEAKAKAEVEAKAKAEEEAKAKAEAEVKAKEEAEAKAKEEAEAKAAAEAEAKPAEEAASEEETKE